MEMAAKTDGVPFFKASMPGGFEIQFLQEEGYATCM
jgi:hypothetical protein